MPTRERRAVVLTGLILSLGITASSTSAGQTLKVGAIPDQNPEKLNRLYGSLAQELSAKLNVPVRYVPVSNYAAAVSAFRTGSLDLVWFGGLTGVQARLQTPGARVLAQRDIDARFTSVFIANGSSGLRSATLRAQPPAYRLVDETMYDTGGADALETNNLAYDVAHASQRVRLLSLVLRDWGVRLRGVADRGPAAP